jgi:hypothetical protein
MHSRLMYAMVPTEEL